MKTMIQLAIDSLENGKQLQFEEIFDYVKANLYDKWISQYSNISEEEEYEMLTRKRGELYKLLTVDSHFRRLNDGSWTTEILYNTK
ncbi:DNA-directed RNA polymerase subunit delta [Mycoplasma procyoni]|uniref:DNA-directed RNA polymerase subunit delta n=1 Tax=Mycoplasma procyoni TaxID=568784 RepID=UPI00197BAE90|nr:DNA-directed RNA polymerase subunit delta [Mycoplasma procyoni]MBN3534928.1 DNA-directed RNA polymerase subunit delta [Mycoplasma procyoni]